MQMQRSACADKAGPRISKIWAFHEPAQMALCSLSNLKAPLCCREDFAGTRIDCRHFQGPDRPQLLIPEACSNSINVDKRPLNDVSCKECRLHQYHTGVKHLKKGLQGWLGHGLKMVIRGVLERPDGELHALLAQAHARIMAIYALLDHLCNHDKAEVKCCSMFLILLVYACSTFSKRHQQRLSCFQIISCTWPCECLYCAWKVPVALDDGPTSKPSQTCLKTLAHTP